MGPASLPIRRGYPEGQRLQGVPSLHTSQEPLWVACSWALCSWIDSSTDLEMPSSGLSSQGQAIPLTAALLRAGR